MSDFQSLIFILCALYLIDCVVWLPEGAFLFRCSHFGRWQVVRQGWQLSLFQSHVYLAPLLPPFGRLFISGNSPVRIDPQGFWLNCSEHEGRQGHASGSYIPFTDMVSVGCNGRKLLCNGKVVARFASPSCAKRTADLLALLKGSSEGRRKELLDAEFQRVLDTSLVQERLAVCRRAGRWLRPACHAEFGLLFIGFPALGELFGFRVHLVPFLLGVLALGYFISREFHRAYGVLYGTPHPSRGSVSAMLMLSPVVATRAFDQLNENAVSDFHPLAVAGAVYPREAFFSETSRYVREWRFPLPDAPSGNSTEHTAAEDWFRKHWQEAIEQFIVKNFGDLAQFLGAPPRESEECRSFCPRCASQYKFEAGHCADCMLPVYSFQKPASPLILR